MSTSPPLAGEWVFGNVDRAMGGHIDPDAHAEGLSFRMLCESSGFGFWQIDTHGRTVYLNPAMRALLELDSLSDLGDETYHRFFSAASLARIRHEHEKRAAGAVSSYEVELIGKRGGRRNVVISGAPLHDGQGNLLGLIGTFMDVTERKRAELQLGASERRMRSLFETSVDAIGVSQAGMHVMANPAYLRMFRVDDAAELIGRPVLEQIAPGERASVSELIQARARGDSPTTHYLTRGLRKSGEEFPLEVHVSSYEESGAPMTVAVLRDVSERLKLDERLRQSQKMDALGRLAGGVAHDFNNLLMVIMGCSDLLLADPGNSESVRTHAQLIQDTGERASSLTRQLLALSRSQVVEQAVVDLRELLAEAYPMLRRLLGPRIELTLESTPSLGHVRADAGQLQQLLMNLCFNARDALPPGGRVWISVHDLALRQGDPRLDPTLSPGTYVVLTVRDDGLGMDEAVRQRVFEPFFTTKTPGRGTGLGLSTAYGIARQSNGHIAVESRPGAGSCFSVYLPAVDAPASQPRAVSVVPPRTRSGTVLLVDDELAVRELLLKFLESVGYHVVAADSGAAALRLIEGGTQVDIVVSDILMPGMSGTELARELDQRAPGIPILFMSGYAHDDGALAIASRPNSCFLSKPFGLADLTGKLRSLLSVGAPTPAHA